MDFLARATALVGGTMVALRRVGAPKAQAVGATPAIPDARSQGIMTLKMPVARGWDAGHVPTAAPCLKVNAFASGLDHPRWIEVLPNGRPRGRVQGAARSPEDPVRSCGAGDDAARPRDRGQRKPRYPLA